MFLSTDGRKRGAGMLAAALVAGLVTAGSAQAAVFIDFLHGEDSTAAAYSITTTDVGQDVQVVIQVLDTMGPADILGVFFDIDGIGDGSVSLVASDPDVTFDDARPDGTLTLAQGGNLNGKFQPGDVVPDPFQFAVTAGSPGSGQDGGITMITLLIETTATADDFTRFGVRAQSTGDGNGSDKAITTNGVIPEPATIALIGLGGLALLRRRR